MHDPTKPLARGPWRYLRDVDVLQSLLVSMLAVVLTGGLIWLAYLWHVWRMAACSATRVRHADIVLIFGRRLRGQQPGADYAQRLHRGLHLAHAGRVRKILLLGGCSGSQVSEAEAGSRWLKARGFPAHVSLVLEHASIDSLENLRHARELLRDERLPPVALVTSRYHLARCMLLARRLGFDAQPIAAEPALPRKPRYAARMLLESGYLMWIDIGMRWAHLIGHQRMVARIR